MFFSRDDKEKKITLPLLPLRDIVLFPHMVVPLFVGREKSVTALVRAMAEDKLLLLAAQQRAKTNDPSAEEIFPVGCIAQIIQLIRLPDGTVKVLVEGKRRAKIVRWVSTDDCFSVEVAPIAEEEPPMESDDQRTELEALLRREEEQLVLGHGALERGHRLLAADEQRHHHVREHDDVAQRQ